MEEKDNGNIVKNIIIATAIIIMVIAFAYIFLQKDNNGVSVSNGSGDKTTHTEDIQRQLDRIAEVLNLVDKKYIDKVDYEKLGTAAIDAILEQTGDVYTYYMDKEKYESLKVEGTEEYVGIGIHTIFDPKKNAAIVFSTMPDTPAEKAGIKGGDILLKINDVEVTRDSYQKCIDSIRGEEGTTVKIQIKRKDEIIDKTITRGSVKANNIESKMIKDNIGYIRILQFENNVAKSFKKEYDKLIASGAKGLVIDVRNNPGGLLNETIDIADYMIKEGVIVETIAKDGTKVTHSAKNSDEITIPLTVLVNSNSASASEILASALKDYEKGILIGEKTYGKGIVQRIEPLLDGGAMSVTSSKYYTKSGIEIHKNGVEPNIEVKLNDQEKANIFFDQDNDKQLKRAIEEINNMLK